MRTLQLKGLIIFKKDFGEQDRIFHIFTEKEGKIEVIAKNVRNGTSKRGGHMELFNYGTVFLYKSPNHYYLNQCETIDEFPKLKSDLNTINAGYFALEILDKLTPLADPHPELLVIILDFLKLLGENSYKSPTLLLAFKIRLLAELGILPPEIVCHKCGNKLAPQTKYIPSQHHFYCDNCTDLNGPQLSPTSIKLFYFLKKAAITDSLRLKNDKHLEESITELTTLTDLFLEENLKNPLKAPQVPLYTNLQSKHY